jgi:hypothetical protein
MGRYKNSGLAHGTSGSCQTNIGQLEYSLAEKMAEAKLEETIKQAEIDSLLKELDSKGVKYNKAALLFVTKDRTGQIVWLEKGNASAGLEHIVSRHANDFKSKMGVEEKNIASTLQDIVKTGQVVSNKTKEIKGRNNFERIYKYKGRYYVLTGIGSNGFLVTAYPVDEKKK